MNNQYSEVLQKSVRIFQLQVLNKENKPKISPLYAGFQELKLRCEKMLQLQAKSQKQRQSLKNQPFHPVIWIDFAEKQGLLQPEKQNNDIASTLIEQFEEILRKSQVQQRKLTSQKIFKASLQNEKMKKFRSCQLISKKKSSITQIVNDNLFVTAKPLKINDFKEQNQKSEKMNIILIHMKLFRNNKNVSQLSDDLLSLGVYLSDEMIINFKQQNQKQQLNKFIQCLESKVSQMRKYHEMGKKKFKVDFILLKQPKLPIEQNLSLSIKFHYLNNRTQKSVQKTLKIIKSDLMQRISFKSYDLSHQNQNKLKNFIKRCEISSRLLTNKQRTKKFYFNNKNEDLFSQQKVIQIEKQMNKQMDLDEQRMIRQKLESFYYRIKLNNKNKGELPSLIEFKIEEFCRQQFKQSTANKIKNKKLVDKIANEYKMKLLENNEREIKKLLQQLIAQYIQTETSNNTQQYQQIKYHPDKINLLIQDYRKIIQTSYMFVTQQIFTQLVYPKMYKHYYHKLYQQYTKIKTINQQNQHINNQLNSNMTNQLQQYKQQFTLSQQNHYKQLSKNKQLNQLITNINTQNNQLKHQLIIWKQKVNDSNKLLLKEQQVQKNLLLKIEQFQQRINQLENNKIQNILHISDQKLTRSQSLKLNNHLLSLQQTINKKTQQSQQSIKLFQSQLNNYKQQYHIIQTQLREKEQFINQREDFYKQKIILLQQQLMFVNKNNNRSIQQSINTKQIQQAYKQTLRQQLQQQYNTKIKQLQQQYQLKINNYNLQCQQYQQIIKSHHQTINHLNNQLYTLKKHILALQNNIEQKQNQFKHYINGQKQKNKQQYQQKNKSSLQQFNLILLQKDLLIKQLQTQNMQINKRLEQKCIKLQQLQDNIHSITTKAQYQNSLQTININLNHKHNHNNKIKHNNNSFLRFQTDNTNNNQITAAISILDDNNPSSISINNTTTKSIYSQKTPTKRSHSKIRTITQIKQDIQLQKLLQQRRTIQKRKQKCNKRQSILNHIQNNHSLLSSNSLVFRQAHNHPIVLSSSSKSIIKQNYLMNQQPFFSTTQSTIFNNNYSNKQQKQQRQKRQYNNQLFPNTNSILKESNKTTKPKSNNTILTNNLNQQHLLKKRLF